MQSLEHLSDCSSGSSIENYLIDSSFNIDAIEIIIDAFKQMETFQRATHGMMDYNLEIEFPELPEGSIALNDIVGLNYSCLGKHCKTLGHRN
jgi:hypothetical protein